MALTVTMPQLGESVTEGTIAKWLKQPGDAIAKYESIAEVITDKVNAEIPAPADGVMAELIAAEGTVVPVGQPICSIDTGVAAPDAAAEPEEKEVAAVGVPAAESAQAAPPEPKTAPAEPQTAPAEPQPVPTASQTAPAEPQAAPAEPNTAPAEPQTAPAEPNTAPAEPQTAPTASSPAPAEPQAAPAQAQAGGETAVGPIQDAFSQSAGAAPASDEAAGGNGQAGSYHVTPAVRMLVREHGVDLSQITGSGIGGRITKKDVLEYVQRRDAGSAAAGTPATVPAPATPPAMSPRQAPQPASTAAPAPASAAPASFTPAGEGETVVPLTQVRKAIAEHMVRSRQTSPHAYVMVEVDMSAVWRIREREKGAFEERYGVKLTFLPFVARAVVEALQRHPTLNASWSDAGIVVKRAINLGIAVALEDNLIVPVVRDADRLSITGLATTMADLGARARSNHLKLDEIQGGTFTLNNTGALGAVMTQAIINQPQAAIMTMDLVVKRPVVVGDAIAIRPIMNLGLSFDHRINDGLQATRFVTSVQKLLEGLDPSGTLV
jgi:pyruvate dehydrogenase E2 component (dihydrolipoamide acetyltransferase)